MKVCECGHTQSAHIVGTEIVYCAECIMISAKMSNETKPHIHHMHRFKESFSSMIEELIRDE